MPTSGDWESVLTGSPKERLESVLRGYVRNRRWFAGKARRLKSAFFSDVLPVPGAVGGAYLATVVISYAEGDADTYQPPLAYANQAEAAHILERWPHSAIAWIRVQQKAGAVAPGGEGRGLLYDALGPPAFAEAVLGAIARRRRATGGEGTLIGSTTRAFVPLRGRQTVKI